MEILDTIKFFFYGTLMIGVLLLGGGVKLRADHNAILERGHKTEVVIKKKINNTHSDGKSTRIDYRFLVAPKFSADISEADYIRINVNESNFRKYSIGDTITIYALRNGKKANLTPPDQGIEIGKTLQKIGLATLALAALLRFIAMPKFTSEDERGSP